MGLPLEPIAGTEQPGPVSTGYSYSVKYLTCGNLAECSTYEHIVNQSVITEELYADQIYSGWYKPK